MEAIREPTTTATDMGPGTTDWTAYTEHYYTSDGIILPPNAEAIEGKENIISFLGSFPPITDMQFNHIKVEGAGDIAYVYGRYFLAMEGEGEEAIQDNGKYLEIWKRQSDGSWKVAIDIFNSDLPISVPEAETAETEM